MSEPVGTSTFENGSFLKGNTVILIYTAVITSNVRYG
jgi:hypothetical protein